MQKYTIGIDLGGTNTKIALSAGNARIFKRLEFPTKSCRNKTVLINTIADKINQLKPCGVIGTGIGVPGLVDARNGVVHCLTNIAGWKDVNLKKELEKKTGIKTYVDNDVNLMALAEAKYGAAIGADSVFCMTLGTGVGGGIVLNGQIYRGAAQSAGEIGHVSINPNGPKCNCGRRGCVEAYVGNSAVIKRAYSSLRTQTKSGRSPGLLRYRARTGNLHITPELITEAAKRGNILARNVWRETAEYLGAGLVIIVNVLDPEVIVIGGGMAGAGKFLFEPLRRYVRKNAMSVPAKRVRIVKAELGNDAGVIGAAELVRVALYAKRR